ncbi:hypothetical protein EVAR_96913_1 [Eumeta japonica]|uniref:Uncharacterized protein n=1 Tax=Eumeta variegata TaxID=151549 RepID=A0A4C1WEN1_EUMVA|nr:hypothetical protein EVAR_96913_1 [Eumeta japonica]
MEKRQKYYTNEICTFSGFEAVSVRVADVGGSSRELALILLQIESVSSVKNCNKVDTLIVTILLQEPDIHNKTMELDFRMLYDLTERKLRNCVQIRNIFETIKRSYDEKMLKKIVIVA